MTGELKRTLELLLLRGGPAGLTRRLSRGRILILAYHNIAPGDEPRRGDRPLHLSRGDFTAQLDLLLETHDVVPLGQVLDDGGQAGRRPRAAITFDDAYRGAVTTGVAELVSRGLPATIFVAPGTLGGGPFWWDELADPELGSPSPSLRARALEADAGRSADVMRRAQREGVSRRDVPDHAHAAAEEELSAALSHPGITVASHTWSHPNLARLTRRELDHELTSSLAWLRERYDAVIPWLSYPYGIRSVTAAHSAAAAGYEAAVTVGGGWVPRVRPDRFGLPRVNVPSAITTPGFALRLANLLC